MIHVIQQKLAEMWKHCRRRMDFCKYIIFSLKLNHPIDLPFAVKTIHETMAEVVCTILDTASCLMLLKRAGWKVISY